MFSVALRMTQQQAATGVRRRDAVASYYHRMVVERDVQNPFEKSNVTGISSYLDMAFELRNNLDQEEGASANQSVRSALKFQLNKAVAVKAAIEASQGGETALSAALILKKWAAKTSGTVVASCHVPLYRSVQP